MLLPASNKVDPFQESLDFGSSIHQDIASANHEDLSLYLENSASPINQSYQQQKVFADKIPSETVNKPAQKPADTAKEGNQIQNSLTQMHTVIKQLNTLAQTEDKKQNKLILNFKRTLAEIHENLQKEQKTQTETRNEFKAKVRKRIQEFKKQKKEELALVEEATFKQQITEFELRQKITGLEEQVSHQQEEINKQANANEILKFEKMRLIQKHQKSLAALGGALQKIQIKSHSRAGSENANKILKIRSDNSEERGRKRGSQRGLAGRSQEKRASDAAPSRASRARNTAQSPNNDQIVEAESNQLSRSFNAGFSTEAPQILNISSTSCEPQQSLKGQLEQLKQMVAQFQDSAKEQKSTEEQMHAYLPKQQSMSDIDFCPDQKLTNNLLRSSLIMQDVDVSDDQNNRAVIMGERNNIEQESKCEDEGDETNVHSFCGDLEKQLNDTSSFAGNHFQENNLPDNLNQCFFQGNTPLESERKAMGKKKSMSDLDQIENLLLQDTQTLNKDKQPGVVEELDSAEREIDDLFSDSMENLQKEYPQKQIRTKQEDTNKAQDVNLDDVLRASVATEIQGQPVDDVLGGSVDKPADPNDDMVNQEASFELNMQDEINQMKPEEENHIENPIDLSSINLNDMSGSENLDALNRNLMPNFVVKVGQKQIKMPLLDIDRVVYLEDRSTFKGNLASQKSLATDTILQTQDAGISQTSGGSFLNDSSCKQLPACVNKGENEQQSVGDGLDNLNVCDQALSAILNAASQSQSQKSLYKIVANELPQKNLLDSLRDEIEQAEEAAHLQQSKEQQSILSPSTSMPFEMRQSKQTEFKMTDSAEIVKASDISVLKQHKANNGQNPAQSSQKHLNRLQDDSQAMRLSELDPVLPAGLTTSQGQTQNVNFKERSGMQAQDEMNGRARAPSEGFARDAKENKDDAVQILSEATPTYASNSGTVTSALANKTRLSAPVNLAPKRLHVAQKRQLKAEDVVKEAENEDSRLVSQTDASQSRILGENDQSWATGVTSAILAYNNAYPRTTKSLKLVNSSSTQSSKQLKTQKGEMRGSDQQSSQEKLKGIRTKLNDASKSVIMKASGNKNNGSSSMHKLKIVKRSSINSVVRAIQNSMEQASVSAERPSICENSRTSVGDTTNLEQFEGNPQNSQYENVSITYKSHHQPQSNQTVALHQAKAVRKSVNSRKTMPIMVNIKNIVRQQKEEQVGTSAKETTETSVQQQRSSSGPRKNVFNLQKLKAAMQNHEEQRGNSVGKSSSIRSGLNISIVKGRVVRDRDNSNPKKISPQVKKVVQKPEPDREGSIVYIGGRKSLIDPKARLQNQRPNSLKASAQETKESNEQEQARHSSVTSKGGKAALSTKVLLAAAQNMRKRKLSIGSQQQMKQSEIDQSGEIKLSSQSRKNASSNKIKIERVNVNSLQNREENKQPSKPTSPKSPRRVSKVSIGRAAQGTADVQRSKERVLSKVPAKKTNIINIKKRGQSKTKDASAAEVKATNQKSKTNQSKASGTRGGSLGPQEEQNERNSSANLADFPALKIKRISRSKTGRGISQNSKKVTTNSVKIKDQQHFQSVNCGNNIGNITSVTATEHAYAENLLIKDQQLSQQNNTLLEDISILSKLKDPSTTKPQVVVVNQKSGKIVRQGAVTQNSANQIMTNLLQQNSNSNQRLVNQSSLHNLAQKFSSAGGITLSAVSASSNANQKSQAHHPLSHSNKNLQTNTAYSINPSLSGKNAFDLASKSQSSNQATRDKKVNIQLVRDSVDSQGVGVDVAHQSDLIESLLSQNNNQSYQAIIQHQNNSLGDFAPHRLSSGFSTQNHSQQQKQVQVSSKAMKVISNKKSQLTGAQQQVQLEWKTPTNNNNNGDVQYQQQRINQKLKKQL